MIPAFGAIRAVRFLTDRIQLLAAHQVLHLLEHFAAMRFHLNPGWTAARMFGVRLPARRINGGDGIGVNGVSHNETTFR